MKLRGIPTGLLLASSVIALCQTTLPAGSPEVDAMYQSNSEVTFSGRVKGIVNTPATSSAAGRTSISVASKNGGNSTVELGPDWYVHHLRKPLKVKDQVTVTGSKIFLAGDSVILARKLIRGNQVLYLREVSGFPMWMAYRGRIDITSNGSVNAGTAYNGTISGLSTFTPPTGDPLSIAQVTTQNGIYNLNLGPAWYWQNQPNRFAMGDQLTFYGSGGITQLYPGLPIFATNRAIRNGEIFTIGSNVVPIWASPNGGR